MRLTLRFVQEPAPDGRWGGIVDALPGVMAYGATREEAKCKTQALALWCLADRLEAGELTSLDHIKFEQIV